MKHRTRFAFGAAFAVIVMIPLIYVYRLELTAEQYMDALSIPVGILGVYMLGYGIDKTLNYFFKSDKKSR